MDTTVSLEFFSESKEHLKTLEHRLKHEHGVSVDMVVPKVATAPVLIAIGIKDDNERAKNTAQRVAQILYHFLHDETASQKQLFLLTIEGERIDIESLSAEQIEEIILKAREEEKEA
jgi:hypothetical protein